MPLDHWFAFLTAFVVILVIPKPTALLVLVYALGRGSKPAAASVFKETLGKLTSIKTSMPASCSVLTISFLMLVFTTPPALSMDFLTDSFGNKVNQGLAAAGQEWQYQKHDCGFLEQINSYVCRYNLGNSIELDAISKSAGDRSNEIVMIWNGIDTVHDSFAYTLAVVTALCSPGHSFNDIKGEISPILPNPNEKDKPTQDIPRRSIEIDGIEYAAKVMSNGFLMVTIKDGNIDHRN